MRTVVQINPKTNELTEYESVSKASQITGINRGNIHSTCQGKHETAGGYKWKFGMISSTSKEIDIKISI